jgi:hypothetical protein
MFVCKIMSSIDKIIEEKMYLFNLMDFSYLLQGNKFNYLFFTKV